MAHKHFVKQFFSGLQTCFGEGHLLTFPSKSTMTLKTAHSLASEGLDP